MTEAVWYFAYGSNMETATLSGRRGITFTRALPARVCGWRLVLDKPPLLPIGEAMANVVPDAGAQTLGVLYQITPADLDHLDLTEGVLIDNYRRLQVPVIPLRAPAGAVTAHMLASDRRDPSLRPSARYMARLIAGAEEHGLPAEHIAFLRRVPVGAETPDAARARALVDQALRRPG